MTGESTQYQQGRRKRQLTLQYMTAVGLIFLLSFLALQLPRKIVGQQEEYAEIISTSGRQAMLSQQIALLTHQLVETTEENSRKELKKRIDSAINLMEQSHLRLTSGTTEDGTRVKLSKTISQMYFQPPHQVDKLVSGYLSEMREFIERPALERSHGELVALTTNSRKILTEELNRIVAQYEKESRANFTSLNNSEMAVFLAMVVLLILIVIFGFRPMAGLVAENEATLHSILDSIPLMLDIVDKEGTILYQSRNMISHLGTSSVGMKCFKAYKTKDESCAACPLSTTGNPGHDYSKMTTNCLDVMGKGSTIEVTHYPIFFESQEAYLHTYHDITEQMETEAYLVKAKDEADQASHLKSSFLANMSHEIRTPLNAIIGFSDLALEVAPEGQLLNYLEKIQNASHSLMAVINDILDFSKIEAGKLDLEDKRFQISEVTDDIAELFSDKARKKNISLLIKPQPQLPQFLIGDPLRLRQVLVNLVSNSIKFTHQGEIIIQATLESQSERKAEIKFSIMDTGIGIADDILSTLFDPFCQADTSTTRKYGGTGLGLTICQQLIDLMGGKIEVDSEEGVGTKFHFTIPFGLPAAKNRKDFHSLENDQSRDPDTYTKETLPLSEQEARDRVAGAHILIVEDNPINAQVTEEVLHKASITLEIAGNGKEALDTIIKQNGFYDAVLMDIQMPEMGGIECTRELRLIEDEWQKTWSHETPYTPIPIIAMTANAMAGDREKYLQAGMDDYIVKPFSRIGLFNALADWIPQNPEERKSAGIQPDTPVDPTKNRAAEQYSTDSGKTEELDSQYPLPQYLPGLDLSEGLDRIEGNVSIYLKLIRDFTTHYHAIDSKILTAVTDGDLETAKRLAHTIKGAAGSIGAHYLAKEAEKLESALNTCDQSDIRLTHFSRALKQLFASLEILPTDEQDAPPPNPAAAPVADEKIQQTLDEFRSLLEGKNFLAESKWLELKPLLTNISEGQRSRIDLAVNGFEFEKALEVLDGIGG
ncbi:MAG: ATP-binding protein [Thermodesulfobacteriota bacterium]